MPPDRNAQAVARNVRLYPWYAVTLNAYFWMPIFFLYFMRHMPLSDVLRLEAIYYVSVVALEVPSGYFSDRVGRRPTLVIASACLVAGYAVFSVGASFVTFALAQVLLAAGLAFNSGTDASLHYDSLASLGRAAEFDTREAMVARNALAATGAAGVIGGAIGMIDLRYAYVLSALASLVSLGIAAAMREPYRHETVLVPERPAVQLRTCRRLLADRVLGWTFAYTIVMTVLNHVPYEFYQPYIGRVLAERGWRGEGTPLAAGVHLGVVMLIGAVFAGWSVRWRDRLGYARALLSATALQIAIILGMGLLVHPVMVMVILLRSVPRALAMAPVNAAVAPRVGRGQRATFLSIQSLCGRLAFGGYLLALSVPAAPGISWRLLVSALAGALAFAVLVATAPRAQSSRRPVRGREEG